MTRDLTQHKAKLSGKDYVMVSGRVLLAHDDNELLSIQTELVKADGDEFTFKATVTTRKGVFTGWAMSRNLQGLAKNSPLEVAETSAIGRALGFAGYALEYGIASADEVEKASAPAPVLRLQTNGNGHTPAPTVPQVRVESLQPQWADSPHDPPAPAGSNATEKQVKAIYAIGRAERRMSEQQVDNRAMEVFGVHPAEFTKTEASQFIEMLKRAGGGE